MRYFKSGSSPDILNLGYDYGANNNGQIQTVHSYTTPGVEDQTKSESFTYDAWSRLKTAQTLTVNANTPGTWSLQWGYDRLGNRLQQNLTGGNVSIGQPQFTIDPATNRITNSGFTYDAAGNMTHDAASAYTYDGANRLTQVGGGTAAYSYFGALRIKKVNGGATTVYVYSGSKPIVEYVNGTMSKEYIYSGSTLLATLAGSSTTYHHPDHLSSRAETDASGNPVRSFGHFPFGETWYETATDKGKFTSYERDSGTGETGLDYAMFRHFASGQGRFLSADLLAGNLLAPQSLNRFTYALNDPINLMDPLGLETPTFRITSHGCAEGGTKVVDSAGNFLYCDYGTGGGGGGYAPLIDPPPETITPVTIDEKRRKVICNSAVLKAIASAFLKAKQANGSGASNSGIQKEAGFAVGPSNLSGDSKINVVGGMGSEASGKMSIPITPGETEAIFHTHQDFNDGLPSTTQNNATRSSDNGDTRTAATFKIDVYVISPAGLSVAPPDVNVATGQGSFFVIQGSNFGDWFDALKKLCGK
jgi:RHS repeat-associated protein